MDELLPTPRAQMAESRNTKPWRRPDNEPQTQEHTSASSPGSEDSTSPSKPSATSASDRSSGTPPAPESSSDGGRLFPDGETSEGSESRLFGTPSAADAMGGHLSRGGNRSNELLLKGEVKALLASPMAGTNRKSAKAMRSSKEDGGNGRRSGGGNSSSPGLEQQVEVLTSSLEGSPANPPAPPAAARAPRTTAGYGPSSPVWLASFDPDSSSWRTSQASLLSTEDERFPRSSERWPTWGMTRRGQAFALPTPERVTDGSGSSSLLPTPDTVVLPTPAARDHEGSDLTSRQGQPGLPDTVKGLLPTPKTPTGGSEKRSSRAKRGSGGEDLEARVRSIGDPTPPQSPDGSES